MSDTVELLQDTLISITKQSKGMMTQEQYEEILLMPINDLDELEHAYNRFQYFIFSNRLIKGAEYLESPELTEEERRKGMKLYDELTQRAREYREVS